MDHPALVPGEWPPVEKLTHSTVDYEHPSEHEGEECAGCRNFINAVGKPRCKHVQDPIRAGDWCERFKPVKNNA